MSNRGSLAELVVEIILVLCYSNRMRKLKELISSVKKGLKKELKKDSDVDLDYAAIKARWNAMCKFVDSATEYGVRYALKNDLAVINSIREQQRPLPTEYQVSTHKGIDEKKLKLLFDKKCILFELEKYTDFDPHQMYQNLQVKFNFDNTQSLTKFSYRDKVELDCGDGDKAMVIYNDAKVIDLRQKQINRADATEMTK